MWPDWLKYITQVYQIFLINFISTLHYQTTAYTWYLKGRKLEINAYSKVGTTKIVCITLIFSLGLFLFVIRCRIFISDDMWWGNIAEVNYFFISYLCENLQTAVQWWRMNTNFLPFELICKFTRVVEFQKQYPLKIISFIFKLRSNHTK